MNGNGDPEKMLNKHMLRDLYTSWFGIAGTDDKGAIHVLRALDEKFDALQDQVHSNTTWRRVLVGSMCILISLIGTLIGVMINSL